VKIHIGLAAKPGGGKGTFPEMFRNVAFKDRQNFSMAINTFSDILRKTYEWYGHNTPSTKDLQDLSDLIYARRPEGLSIAMRNRLTDKNNLNLFADIQIVDGVRRASDEEMIRSLPNSFLIYVFADPQKRFERVKLRGQRPGEREMTWEQFTQLDNRPTETLVDDIGSRADFRIDNNGTIEEYETQVKKIYKEILKPILIKNEIPS